MAPLTRQWQDGAAAQKDQGVPPMKITALLIEDNAQIRALLQHYLKSTQLAEFTFLEAADGVSGLEKLDPSRVDMVFVDIHMPGMSGVEFVRRARKKYPKEPFPIVMVTAEQRIGYIEDALDGAAADAYVTKPFSRAEISRRIAPLVDRAMSRKQSRPSLWKALGFCPSRRRGETAHPVIHQVPPQR